MQYLKRMGYGEGQTLYAFFSIYIILYFEYTFPNILINFDMNYEPFSKYIQNDL